MIMADLILIGVGIYITIWLITVAIRIIGVIILFLTEKGGENNA